MLKIYKISQTQNNNYDTYDSAVVCAPDEEAARNMNPNRNGEQPYDWSESFSAWCSGPEHVMVDYLGEAVPHLESGVLCASFNAG